MAGARKTPGDPPEALPSFASERELPVASEEMLEHTRLMPNAPPRSRQVRGARQQAESMQAPMTERLPFESAQSPPPPASERTMVTGMPPAITAMMAPLDMRPAGGSLQAPSAVGAEMEAVQPVEIGRVKERAIFREQAVQSYLASMRERDVLRVAPPWARHFLTVASFTIFGLVVASFFVKIDQTGRGRGALRIAGGVQAVACQTTGVVQELTARSGDLVAAGAILAKIDSSATKMALLEAERQIERAEESVTSFAAQRDKEQAARIRLLQQRAGLLARRAQSQRATVERLRQRVGTFDKLASEGLASALDKNAVENELAAGQRGAIELDEEVASTQLQISSIAAEMATELAKRKAEVKKAVDQREALNFQLQQTEVRTPRAGRLEALVVKVGDPVSVGMTIARIIPEGAPREIVVFLPEADRAFLHDGSEVRVELDQLPVGEFGGLQAKVTRIAGDLATPAEIQEALSDTKVEGPSYRVELAIRDGDAVKRLDKMLRPGSLVTARFVLRRRRLATVVFEPLRRFVD